MGRPIFLAIPLLTVALVGTLALWAGGSRTVKYARVHGGPTDSRPRWTGWIQVFADETPRAGLSVRVAGTSPSGARAEATVALDRDGQGELVLDFGAAPPQSFRLRIEAEGRVLAEGDVALPARIWRGRAARRGGFYSVGTHGNAGVRVAAARGAFAAPFPGPLWIRVEHPPLEPAAGARIELRVEGARVQPSRLSTDAQGVAEAELTPTEHAVTLDATITLANGEVSRATTSVPVVPGAFVAERRDDVLAIASPVERAEAFVTLVSEDARLGGARVPLVTDARGIARGELALLPELRWQGGASGGSGSAPEKIWAVLESTRPAPSGARVGWPLFRSPGEPALTFDAGDELLLDGFPAARDRERARQRRVGRIVIAIGLLGALASALSVLIRARREKRHFAAELDAELDPEAKARVVVASTRGEIVSIVLIFVGFILTAVILAWRFT